MGMEKPEEEHEGEKYLRLLGLEDIADKPIRTVDGVTTYGRDFLDICRKHAEPALVGLASLSPDDPMFAPSQTVIRERVEAYLAAAAEGEAPS